MNTEQNKPELSAYIQNQETTEEGLNFTKVETFSQYRELLRKEVGEELYGIIALLYYNECGPHDNGKTDPVRQCEHIKSQLQRLIAQGRLKVNA